ncbi:unnamed protein product, partial [Hapterophycus canaliculatus]
DLQLVWQVTVSRAPVALTVAKLGVFPGIVCSLDDEGVLNACYQGTDPPTSSVVAAETKEVDYDQINQEHRSLLQASACRVIRRSQADSARPPAGKLTLQVQVPRFADDHGAQQKGQKRRQDGGRQTGSLSDDDPPQDSFEGSLQPLPPLVQDQRQERHHLDVVSVTASFVVSYSGPGEIRNATLNISTPPGFSADPSSAVLPPIRGKGKETGTGTGEGRGGEARGSSGGDAKEPLVVPVVLTAERGAGRIPSTLVGQASVVYAKQEAGGDGQSQPMSARCELRLPLTLAGRLVEPTARKGANAHKFTFNTSRPAVRLSTLFEDLVVSSQTGEWSGDGGGGGFSCSTARGSLSTEDSESNGAGGSPAVGLADGGGVALISGIGGESTTLSLRYWAADVDLVAGSQDVSVAVSKNSGRYRVQSESLPALCVLATEVVRRL